MTRTAAPWRCYLRWPPGHRWVRVHGSEDSLAHLVRCTNCGKEKEHKKLPGGGTVRKRSAGYALTMVRR